MAAAHRDSYTVTDKYLTTAQGARLFLHQNQNLNYCCLQPESLPLKPFVTLNTVRFYLLSVKTFLLETVFHIKCIFCIRNTGTKEMRTIVVYAENMMNKDY